MSLALRQISGLLSVMQADVAAVSALREILSALRSYMQMQAVFLAEAGEAHRVYLVESAGMKGLAEGRLDPCQSTLSHAVLSGTVPEVVGDLDPSPLAKEIPFCREFGIRSFISVPVRLSNGETFGALCCFDPEPRPDLGQASADLMRVAADLVGRHLTRLRQADDASSRFRGRLDQTIATGAICFAHQPIIELATGSVAGTEYLSRFPLFPGVPVNMVFEQSNLVAADRDLEGEVLRRLSRGIAGLSSESRAFINVSPRFIANGRCAEIFGPMLDRTVLEVLEEKLDGVEGDIQAALAESGVAYSLAVDDFGVGHSNLARVLAVQPDYVKVDRSLVSDIDRDPARRALMSALVRFSRGTGVQLIAEGVEREGEAAALSRVGVRLAQGYHFARPALCDW